MTGTAPTRQRPLRAAAWLTALALVATGCAFSVGTDSAEDTTASDQPEPADASDAAEEEGAATEDDDPEAAEAATEETAERPARPTVPAPDPTPTAAPAPPPAQPAQPAQGGGTTFTQEVPMTGAPAEAPYSGYTTVTDDLGRITVDVPLEWRDVDGAPVQQGGVTISDVRASSDLAAFASTWTTPGMAVSAADLPGTTPAQVLETERGTFGTQCTFESRNPYSDPLYVGEFDIYRDCGGTGVTYVVVAAQLPDGSGPIIEVQVQVVSERDLEALDRIVNSFVVT